jgi:hypothetical protein
MESSSEAPPPPESASSGESGSSAEVDTTAVDAEGAGGGAPNEEVESTGEDRGSEPTGEVEASESWAESLERIGSDFIDSLLDLGDALSSFVEGVHLDSDSEIGLGEVAEEVERLQDEANDSEPRNYAADGLRSLFVGAFIGLSAQFLDIHAHIASDQIRLEQIRSEAAIEAPDGPTATAAPQEQSEADRLIADIDAKKKEADDLRDKLQDLQKSLRESRGRKKPEIPTDPDTPYVEARPFGQPGEIANDN